MNKVFELDGIKIGIGEPTFIVAEIGINHNGDMILAKESIAAAAESGADSVKFQNYSTEDFISNRSISLKYKSNGKLKSESQYDIFKRCELNLDQLGLLREEALRHGLDFHSTPTSIKGLKDIISIGCRIVKNGSDFLTNLELIREFGESGLITVLSTGMASISEIDEAVRVFRETGNKNLILLHCTSAYPTPAEEVHLLKIKTLKHLFNTPIGFSDHSNGIIAGIGATLMGACWIEKHFTLDKKMEGPDHWFSMDPQDLKNLVNSIREIEKMTGTPQIGPSLIEMQSRENFRLSCVASRDILEGEKIKKEDIIFQRPGNGYPPSAAEYIIGLRATTPIRFGETFCMEHFNE